MNILQTTAVTLGVLLMLGVAQEGKAAVIQPIAPPTQRDHVILTHGGGHGGHHHGGHWRGHHGGHHGGHWGGGGFYYGPAFQRVCGFDMFGQYSCHRRYY